MTPVNLRTAGGFAWLRNDRVRNWAQAVMAGDIRGARPDFFWINDGDVNSVPFDYAGGRTGWRSGSTVNFRIGKNCGANDYFWFTCLCTTDVYTPHTGPQLTYGMGAGNGVGFGYGGSSGYGNDHWGSSGSNLWYLRGSVSWGGMYDPSQNPYVPGGKFLGLHLASVASTSWQTATDAVFNDDPSGMGIGLAGGTGSPNAGDDLLQISNVPSHRFPDAANFTSKITCHAVIGWLSDISGGSTLNPPYSTRIVNAAHLPTSIRSSEAFRMFLPKERRRYFLPAEAPAPTYSLSAPGVTDIWPDSAKAVVTFDFNPDSVGLLYAVVGPAAGWTDPTAEEIEDGTLAGGGPATFANDWVTPASAGAWESPSYLTSLSPATEYKIAFVYVNGGVYSNVVVSDVWETLPASSIPTLSLPTVVAVTSVKVRPRITLTF